jgi:hypothetical protein
LWPHAFDLKRSERVGGDGVDARLALAALLAR